MVSMKIAKSLRWLRLGLLSVLLTACAGQTMNTPAPERSTQTVQPPAPSRPSTAPPGAATAPAPAKPQQPAPVSRNPAVIALLTQADQQSRAQQLDAASATLERALRLDPRNAELWYRLAKLRLDQRRPEQAQSLAYKSISLAGRNNRLLQIDWQLIAQTKALLGDTAGSQQAAARAQALQP